MLFNVVVIEAAPDQSAFVTNLPGFNGTFPSKHYSRYVSIENQGGVLPPKNLFYYFIESERNPSKDPLVLWLNGGPGCSSIDGFIYEHVQSVGRHPTIIRKNLDIDSHKDKRTQKIVSNIIYLDSPAGVGFSYCIDNTSYTTGDIKIAADTHKFLLSSNMKNLVQIHFIFLENFMLEFISPFLLLKFIMVIYYFVYKYYNKRLNRHSFVIKLRIIFHSPVNKVTINFNIGVPSKGFSLTLASKGLAVVLLSKLVEYGQKHLFESHRRYLCQCWKQRNNGINKEVWRGIM
ncbi:hypothetical protein ACOSP7_013816 [Xanthoceras sorbifolium]